ncbi:catalase-like domain-containing protein [Mycena leptocephala]|nr:catalase-like domain-containing protein [Mycena leptocephala]
MSTVGGTIKNALTSMTNNAKIADLQRCTVEATPSTGLTTDMALRMTDGATGLARLLEDQIARRRFIDLTTNAFPSGAYEGSAASQFTYAPHVQGSRGSADTVRDVRGFAVKMYTTRELGPRRKQHSVFFIQDAIKFPDFVHAVKPEPHNEVPTGQTGECTHGVLAMSDRGTFGVNTYTLLNASGERFFVKFHWLPELGEAIENGAPPKWTLAIQTIAEKDEHNFEFDILDATKIWPTELVPLHEIGEMVLDRTVDEYFPETEQIAFCTSTDDPLLQGRNFSYFDTQLSRLGTNWSRSLPINRPVCPVMNHNRDGQHQTRINKSHVNYWPNRLNAGPPVPATQGGYHDFAQQVAGIKQRVRTPKFQEHFNQAQLFVNSLSPPEKAHMIAAFSFELSHCDDPVVYESYTKLLNNIDFELATAVATNVGGVLPTEIARANRGRRPSGSARWIHAEDAHDQCGRREGVAADHHFEGQRSTMFDALYFPNGDAEYGAALRANGRVRHWIAEAFGIARRLRDLGKVCQTTIQHTLAPFLRFRRVTTSYGVTTSGKYTLLSAAADVATFASGGDGFVSNFAHEISKHRKVAY